MKKIILGSFIIIISFFIYSEKETNTFRHKCNENEAENYSKVHIPISFMPGKKKCLTRNFNNFRSSTKTHDTYYYRSLKEFIMTKNNKYCLWDSKNWDEECQDASMEYAYGDYDENNPRSSKNYTEFKKAVIDFIKYVQANDIEKALTLTNEKAMFFTDDQTNCLIQEKHGSPGHCRAYFKQNSEYRSYEGEINLEAFRKNLMQIDADNIKFFLDDLSHSYIYSVVIPYEYKGIRKYFDIRFYFGINGGGCAYPYDNICYPRIYDLGINSKLPARNSNESP